MHLHAAWWFAAGLSIGLAARWIPWRRLMRFCAQPGVQAVAWPACGALIVLLSALSVSAWRAHKEPGVAPLAGMWSGSAVATGASASGAAPGSSGAVTGASVHPAAANLSAHGTANLDVVLAKLERRLRGGSVDPNDWELLAQTYAYLGRSDDARNARQRHIVAAAAMLADADNQAPQILGAQDADSADSVFGTDLSHQR